MFSDVVMDLPKSSFERVIDEMKEARGITQDTEFIAQMAQFSSLQGMKTLQEYQLQSYAVSYAGNRTAL